MTAGSITDAVAVLMREHVDSLVIANVVGIAEELQANSEGKLSVSIPVKLTLIGSKVFIAVGISYARKFEDEAEGFVDTDQENLPGLARESGVKRFMEISRESDAPISPIEGAVVVKARKKKEAE